MTKLSKKLLAFSTSVILASSVMLSGCGEIEGDMDEEKKSITQNVTSVFNTVNNASDTIVSAMKGETDTAYSADITISIGETIAKQSGMKDIEDIKISTDSKIKSGNAQVTFEAAYGSDSIITFDMVREKETGNIYLSIPELSPASLLIPEDYVATLAEQNMDVMGSMTIPEGFEGNDVMDVELPDVDVSEMPEFDDAEMQALIDETVKIIEEKMPSLTDAGDVSGKVGDVEYTLDKKTMTITKEDVSAMMTALCEEFKTNETFLSMIETYGAEEGLTKEAFVAEIDSAIAQMDTTLGEFNDVTFDIYYMGEDVAGFSFTTPDNLGIEALYYVAETECCAKIEMTSPEADDTVLMELTAETDGYETELWAQADTAETNMELNVTDFKVVDEESGAFQGTMEFEVLDKVTKQSYTYKAVSKSTATKIDVELSLYENNDEIITVGFVGEETTASDVKIPAGQVFDMTDEAQFEAYAATVDIEGFQQKLMDIIGEDMGMGGMDMGALMGGMDMGDIDMGAMMEGMTEEDLEDMYENMDPSMFEGLV